MTRTRVALAAAALVVAALVAGGLIVVLGGGDESSAAFCDQLNDIYRTNSRASLTNLEDTVAVEDELRSMQAQFAGLRTSAPSEIADDVAAIAEWADRVAQAALENPRSEGFDRASALIVASEGAPQLQAPLLRLDTYRAESC
jgi:hypothetical protein